MKTILLSLSMIAGCLLLSSSAEPIHNVTAPLDEVFTTVIQDAIDAAEDGDVVVLGPGTYYEQNIYLRGKAITVQSQTPADPAATVINCDDFFSGFIFANGETASTVLDGLTIIHSAWGSGGAIVCDFDSVETMRPSAPTIRNCVITKNLAWTEGAGIFITWDCSPVVENCVFYQNTSEQAGGAVSTGGNPIFTNCQFIDNSAAWWGGAIYAFGGSPVFKNCVIAGNHAERGGAFYFVNTDQPVILGCTVIDNTTSVAACGVYANTFNSLTIEDSLFWGNAVAAGGENLRTIDISGQGDHSQTRIAYCDIENLETALGYENPALTTVEGLIEAEPKLVQNGSFTDAGLYVPGDWHLQKQSSCVNKGNPAYLPDEKDIDGEKRVMNGRVDVGADEVEVGIVAKINIVPGKLILPGKGFVLAMIRLPEGYSVKDIDAKSILWNDVLTARCVEKCRHNAIAVFDLGKVSELLGDAEGKVEIKISGQLKDGTAFAGSDTIQVSQFHWKHWFGKLSHSAWK